MKKEIKKKKIYYLKHGDYEYPITYQLIKDGRKNKVLNKKINSKNKSYNDSWSKKMNQFQ